MQLERWWTDVATATLAGRTGAKADWLEPRIDVHRTNYREARVAALAQVYPAVERVIGADCFGAWAREYVAGNASVEPDLNQHGLDFPAWLRRCRVERLAGLDYLPDLARLERAVNSAYYVADSAAESGLDAQGGRCVAPSLRLVASPYPVDEIWRVNLAGAPAESVAATSEWRRVVVWRPAREVMMEAVPARLFRALRRLRRDGRLEVLVESGLEPQDAAALVTHGCAGLRRRWLAVAASLVVAALAVLWLGPPGGMENRVPALADEIAMNHIAPKSLDLEARTVAELREPFATLGFAVQPLPSGRAFGPLEGGRFCSVQTVPAALLRYQHEPGKPGHVTVYQAPYLPAKHGKLPDADRGERPVIAMSRGVVVELWTSRGLLFAIAREDTGAP